MIRGCRVALICLSAATLSTPSAAQTALASAEGVTAAISKLGAFDFPERTEAARLVRRASRDVAVPALAQAVRSHQDEYVRYRALVLLSGFGQGAAEPLMLAMLGDRNDRIRTVAYQWFEHHPGGEVLPRLITALGSEQSEFVRPALTRAIAAHGSDPRAQKVLIPLVLRGEDQFRGALIEAIGDYKGTYASSSIEQVANLDGPLQDDAATALGKIEGASSLALLASLRANGPAELQPTLAAAMCLRGIDCTAQEAYLRKTLVFAATDDSELPLLRSVAHAMGMLAIAGRTGALEVLLDAGSRSKDPAREALALVIGLVALRQPLQLVQALEGRGGSNAAEARSDSKETLAVIQDAFDMLSEDFEEERFYSEVRQAYWGAPEGSARRRTAGLLIDTLEF